MVHMLDKRWTACFKGCDCWIVMYLRKIRSKNNIRDVLNHIKFPLIPNRHRLDSTCAFSEKRKGTKTP